MATKYKECGKCGYFDVGFGCENKLLREALAYIWRLERERDAAVEQLKEDDKADLFRCSHCKHEELTLCEIVDCENCDKECPCTTCIHMSNWEWIGAQEVE